MQAFLKTGKSTSKDIPKPSSSTSTAEKRKAPIPWVEK